MDNSRPGQAGRAVLASVWVPTDDERKAIANGSNIELVVWGSGHPPVGMGVTEVELFKA